MDLLLFLSQKEKKLTAAAVVFVAPVIPVRFARTAIARIVLPLATADVIVQTVVIENVAIADSI